MKIGILTQPLVNNYGGLLQAWALQKFLKNSGYESIIINRVFNEQKDNWINNIISIIKDKFLISTGKRKPHIHITSCLLNYVLRNTNNFIFNQYSGISERLISDIQFKRFVNTNEFDAFIVGSDQVWRPNYSPNLMTYFLDFAQYNKKVKKIAYAASFGTDNWEFSEKQTKEASHLISMFDLVSVREDSGVKLVNTYLHSNAHHVCDPTLLIDKAEYVSLVKNSSCEINDSNGEVFCYVLDKSPIISEIISHCKQDTKLTPYYCISRNKLHLITGKDQLDECVTPPVEQWIKSFMDAKMVITDSFHGMVFSIIFNKPFWIIINEERGASRFTSLLKQLNLANRIITNAYDVKWDEEIDWRKVNRLKESLAKASSKLLISHLE